MTYCLYHRPRRLAGADELLIYPVLELDGIVNSYADQDRKCGHRYHGEGYMQEAHGTEGPANPQKDDWNGEERPLHLVECQKQCHYHQKSRQEEDRAVALGHLPCNGVHQGRLAGDRQSGVRRKAGQLQLAFCLLVQLPLLGFREGDRQIYGEHGMAAIGQYR